MYSTRTTKRHLIIINDQILFFLEVVCLKVYKLQTLYQTAGITLLENIAPANVESKQATGFHMYAKQPMETLAENYQANL